MTRCNKRCQGASALGLEAWLAAHPRALSQDVSPKGVGVWGLLALRAAPTFPEAPADPGSGLSDLSWIDGRAVSEVSPPCDRTRAGRLECHAVQRNVSGSHSRTHTDRALWGWGRSRPCGGPWGRARLHEGPLLPQKRHWPPPVLPSIQVASTTHHDRRPSLLNLQTAFSPDGIPATCGTWTLGFMAPLLGLRDARLISRPWCPCL